MKYNEAEMLLKDALKSFDEVMQCDFSDEVYLLARSDVKSKRPEVFKKLKAEFEEFAQSTLGETIYGTEGTAILVYPFNINNKSEFLHTVFHECAHKLFKEINPEITHKQFGREYGKRKLYAYTLFDEFIADAIANFVAHAEPPLDISSKQKELIERLYQALPGINPESTMAARGERMIYRQGYKILPAALGIYCAMILTDPAIIDLMQKDPRFERGFSACGNALANAVEDVIEWLANYLQTHEDYVISDDELDELGKLVIRFENIR